MLSEKDKRKSIEKKSNNDQCFLAYQSHLSIITPPQFVFFSL